MQLLEGGIEALDVPDLQGHAVALGDADKVLGLGERAGEGLFDQEGNALAQKVARDGVMQ